MRESRGKLVYTHAHLADPLVASACDGWHGAIDGSARGVLRTECEWLCPMRTAVSTREVPQLRATLQQIVQNSRARAAETERTVREEGNGEGGGVQEVAHER